MLEGGVADDAQLIVSEVQPFQPFQTLQRVGRQHGQSVAGQAQLRQPVQRREGSVGHLSRKSSQKNSVTLVFQENSIMTRSIR